MEPFAPRAAVTLADGEPALALENASVDRFVATYVLDLLSAGEQRAFLAEAARVLKHDGLLCLVGITPGATFLSRVVMGLWQQLFELNPRWVGGCRPARITD